MQHQTNAFSVLKIVHIGLLVSMAMFDIVSLIIVLEGIPVIADESLQRSLQVGCVMLSALLLIGGFRIFKKRIFTARNSAEAGEKRMEMYRSACIMWWAMIEVPGIVAGIAFIITGNFAFFALAVFHLLAMLVFAPRKANIILFLNLNSNEVAKLTGNS
ncbi:hypothetical protein [Niastella populi]|uniref:Uncharacterized protein n=1 Tax=Niastella populi TaxID=550983 RepID=A0A1V9GBW4_9BACT|nr:hypothetical protein [Niastella populi]OQP68070.1 hypothetical protein A4R26_11320 [Niastella populi]